MTAASEELASLVEEARPVRTLKVDVPQAVALRLAVQRDRPVWSSQPVTGAYSCTLAPGACHPGFSGRRLSRRSLFLSWQCRVGLAALSLLLAGSLGVAFVTLGGATVGTSRRKRPVEPQLLDQSTEHRSLCANQISWGVCFSVLTAGKRLDEIAVLCVLVRQSSPLPVDVSSDIFAMNAYYNSAKDEQSEMDAALDKTGACGQNASTSSPSNASGVKGPVAANSTHLTEGSSTSSLSNISGAIGPVTANSTTITEGSSASSASNVSGASGPVMANSTNATVGFSTSSASNVSGASGPMMANSTNVTTGSSASSSSNVSGASWPLMANGTNLSEGAGSCSWMGGTDCKGLLDSWAGSGTCVHHISTNGISCQQHCAVQASTCVKAMDNLGLCGVNESGHSRQTTAENGCLQEWMDQVCVCEPVATTACAHHNASACLEHGDPDNDCCAMPGQGSCAIGYIFSQLGQCHSNGAMTSCCQVVRETWPPATRQMTSTVPAGTNVLPLADVSGISPGDNVKISGDGHSETKTVISVGNPDERRLRTGFLSVSSDFMHTYSRGAMVEKVKVARGSVSENVALAPVATTSQPRTKLAVDVSVPGLSMVVPGDATVGAN